MKQDKSERVFEDMKFIVQSNIVKHKRENILEIAAFR